MPWTLAVSSSIIVSWLQLQRTTCPPSMWHSLSQVRIKINLPLLLNFFQIFSKFFQHKINGFCRNKIESDLSYYLLKSLSLLLLWTARINSISASFVAWHCYKSITKYCIINIRPSLLGYTWLDIAACVQWMAPFAMTLRETGSQDLKFFQHIAREDAHNIQTHSVDLSLLVSVFII